MTAPTTTGTAGTDLVPVTTRRTPVPMRIIDAPATRQAISTPPPATLPRVDSWVLRFAWIGMGATFAAAATAKEADFPAEVAIGVISALMLTVAILAFISRRARMCTHTHNR